MFEKNYIFIFLCLMLFVTKVLATFYTNFNLYGDEAQYWIWSQNLDLGYYSKPPFLAWFVGLVVVFFGDSFFVLKMIPIITYALTSIIFYSLVYELYKDKNLSLIAAVSFFSMPAVSFSSFILSTDVFLILFWIMGMTQVLRLKNNQGFINYFLLGFFVGLGFLSKYAAVYFIISFLILLILERKNFKKVINNRLGLLLSFFVFIITISPNIVWNINNGWSTLFHTADNASLESINFNFVGGLNFLLSQILMVGPFLFFLFLFFIRFGFKYSFVNNFLLCFSLPAFLIVLVEGFAVRAHANWAAVSLISFFIFFISVVYRFNKNLLNINFYINFIFGFVLFVLIASSSSLKFFDRIRGMSDFAANLKDYYVGHSSNIVVSDRVLFAGLSYELRLEGLKFYAPIQNKKNSKNHFQLKNSLPKNFNKNFILIGHKNEINYLTNKNVKKKLTEKKVLFTKEKIKIYEIVFK